MKDMVFDQIKHNKREYHITKNNIRYLLTTIPEFVKYTRYCVNYDRFGISRLQNSMAYHEKGFILYSYVRNNVKKLFILFLFFLSL